MSEALLSAQVRTEFGKGAARRTRRAGKIPAVLYGHGSDPRHLSLPHIEFARVLREHGSNAVVSLNIDGSRELALTKSVIVHPLRNYIEHVDLLLVRRGEKVTVEVPVNLVGDAAPSTLVTQDLNVVEVEAEALHLPEGLELSIAGAAAGTQFHVSDIILPKGVTLVTEAEALVAVVNEAKTIAVEAPAAAEATTEESSES